MARKQPIVLPAEYQELNAAIGFDPAVLAAVLAFNDPESKAPLLPRRLIVERFGTDDHLRAEPSAGFCFDAERYRAELLMTDLRGKFESKGYLFFLTACGAPEPPATVAVIQGTDPYDILRFMGTEDVNGDKTTDDIIATLRQWEAEHPFRVQGAGRDWVECRFRKNPADMLAFARQVIAFAPDSYGQGGDFEDEADFADAMRRARSFHLWWD